MSSNLPVIQHSLNGGEVSERFDARLDQNKRLAGCARLINWVPLTLGGVKRRDGLICVTECRVVDDHPIKRLVAFKPSNDASYILEVGHLYMRFYRDGAALLTSSGGELIVNGGFDTDLAGWTDADSGTGVSQWRLSSEGKPVMGLVVALGTVGTAARYQSIVTVAGSPYRLLFTILDHSATVLIGTSAGGSQIYANALGPGAYSVDFIATTTSTFIYFRHSGGPYADIDIVGCKLIGNLHTELITPWNDTDLYGLYVPVVQSVDVAYFLHKDFPPYKLLRITPTTFTITEVNFDPPATIEEEPTGHIRGLGTMTPAATTGTGITFEFSGTGLVASDVGRLLVSGAARGHIATVVDGNTATVDIIDAFASTAAIADTAYRFVLSPQADLDITDKKKEVGELVILTATLAAFEARMVGMWITAYGGLLKIDSVTDSTHVHATIKTRLTDITENNPDATAAWTLEERAWSATLGYPDSGTFFDERLFLCKGLTINGSVVGDYENFGKGADADAAIQRTISDDDTDPIVWVKGGEELIVGTGSGAYIVRPTSPNGALTQTSFSVRPVSTRKCAKPPPLRIGNQILYVQYGERKIRELVFDFATNKFRSPNILLVADHLTSKTARITELGYAEEPDSIIYVMRSDGVLLICVYQEDENVIGWGRFTTDGLFKTQAVIPRPATGDDWVWVIVDRDDHWFVEYFEPAAVEPGREWSEIQTDSARFHTHTNFVISNLEYLEGKTVRIIGDGKLYDDQVVTDGEVAVSPEVSATKFEVGLNYDSDCITLEPLVPMELGGPMQTKGLQDIGVRVRRTLGLTINGEQLAYRKPIHPMNEQVPLQRGKKAIKNMGYDPFCRVRLQQTLPFPAEVLNVFGQLHVGDRWDSDTEDAEEEA